MSQLSEDEPIGEPSEVEKLLGFRVQDGKVWSEKFKFWCVPRIDHLQKAIEVIKTLLQVR